MADVRPIRLHKLDEDTLGIDWSDGVSARYPVRLLRQRCPCAVCVDEVSGERTLDPEAVAAGVRPVEIKPVGRYALHIRWSDGHETGIYSYDLLRALHRELTAERPPA
ncbi:MAG: DUF971 domain-containing protein [Planctomycetes bacterium]|nr:DUF971 domain-containing protein [Planctomycetota bacterium]